MSKKYDLVGIRFGRLTVDSFAGSIKKNKHWNCICDCGGKTISSTHGLRTGGTKSCGCYRAERRLEVIVTHGKSRTSIHRRWVNMINRCTNPDDPAYQHYGARGISVCDSWLTFENFYRDVGEIPKGMTLDRIDNEKGYEPSNIRWASAKDQMRNRRITLKFEGKPLTEIAEETGVPYMTLYSRLKKYGTPFKENQNAKN